MHEIPGDRGGISGLQLQKAATEIFWLIREEIPVQPAAEIAVRTVRDFIAAQPDKL